MNPFEILEECLREAGDDVQSGLVAAEYILSDELNSDRSLSAVPSVKWTEDNYPRDNSGRFLDKYKIAEATRDQKVASEVRDSIPEDQRRKFDIAITHLQSGGSIYHPRESSSKAIGVDGYILDRRWSYYEEDLAARQAWEEREAERVAARTALKEVTMRLSLKNKIELLDHKELEKEMIALGPTRVELRQLSRGVRRIKLKFGDGVNSGSPQALLELVDLYENLIESVHQRIDAESSGDPESEIPTEPESEPE